MAEPAETPESTPSGRSRWLESEGIIRALVLVIGVLTGVGTTRELTPTQAAASSEALAATKAELLQALAQSEAKRSEQAAKQAELLATLVARANDRDRRLERVEGALEARTASRYTQEDAARDRGATADRERQRSAAQAERDRLQDERIKQLEQAVKR